MPQPLSPNLPNAPAPDSQPTPIQILRWEDGRLSSHFDHLAEEEPLEIRLRGRSISITMRTPGHDAELAAGFLLTEGIITGPTGILRIEHCDQSEDNNIINVQLAPEVYVDFDRLTRHLFASSSCGLCGRATIDAVKSQFPPIDSGDFQIDAETIAQMPAKMLAAQSAFHQTGGLHAAAIFDERGNLIVLREDIGRHNAVDKVIGHCLLNSRFPLNRHVLLVSGRTSFEILQKALAARLPIIAAISAPSSLAAKFAGSANQTLVGFLRNRRMNIYSSPHRISFATESDSNG